MGTAAWYTNTWIYAVLLLWTLVALVAITNEVEMNIPVCISWGLCPGYGYQHLI